MALQELCRVSEFCPLISPILVPVNSTKRLATAIYEMSSAGMQSTLVINSSKGAPTDKYELIAQFKNNFELKTVRVGYVVRSSTVVQNIENLMAEFDNACYTFIFDYPNSEVAKYVNELEIDCVIVIDYGSTKSNRNFKRSFGKSQVVILDDYFQARERNSDYLDIVESQYSSDCYFYKDEDFIGFSDYTITGSAYSEGGFAPYAVAVHLTCPKPSEPCLYVRHYVSDTNDSIDDVNNKFQEAVDKVAADSTILEFSTSGLKEILELQEEGRYRGLGYLKKLTIKHHIEVVVKQMKR